MPTFSEAVIEGRPGVLPPTDNVGMTAQLMNGLRTVSRLAFDFKTESIGNHIHPRWSMKNYGNRIRLEISLRKPEPGSCGDFQGYAAILETIDERLAKALGLKPEVTPALIVRGRNTDGQADKLAEFIEKTTHASEMVGTVYVFVGPDNLTGENGQAPEMIKLTRVTPDFEDPDDQREPVSSDHGYTKYLRSQMTPEDYGFVHFVMCNMWQRMASTWRRLHESEEEEFQE
jgi:hypothetical protein